MQRQGILWSYMEWYKERDVCVCGGGVIPRRKCRKVHPAVNKSTDDAARRQFGQGFATNGVTTAQSSKRLRHLNCFVGIVMWSSKRLYKVTLRQATV